MRGISNLIPTVLFLPTKAHVLKKRQIEVAVLSNIHLGAESCKADALLAYLSSISPKILVLNGTVLEAVPAARSAFPSRHFRIFKKLFSMASSGTKIYYVYKNHDAIVRLFQDRSPGNIYFTKNLFLNLDDKRAWFTHGDFLESPLLSKKWVRGMGTGRLRILAGIIRFQHKAWNFIRKRRGGILLPEAACYEDRLKKDETLRKTTVKLAIGRGCDYLICGAPHRLSNIWLDTPIGKCQYLSAGDWIENLTALEYNFKRWKSYRYSEDKLSPFFADEDLKKMNEEEILSKNFKAGASMAG